MTSVTKASLIIISLVSLKGVFVSSDRSLFDDEPQHGASARGQSKGDHDINNDYQYEDVQFLPNALPTVRLDKFTKETFASNDYYDYEDLNEVVIDARSDDEDAEKVSLFDLENGSSSRSRSRGSSGKGASSFRELTGSSPREFGNKARARGRKGERRNHNANRQNSREFFGALPPGPPAPPPPPENNRNDSEENGTNDEAASNGNSRGDYSQFAVSQSKDSGTYHGQSDQGKNTQIIITLNSEPKSYVIGAGGKEHSNKSGYYMEEKDEVTVIPPSSTVGPPAPPPSADAPNPVYTAPQSSPTNDYLAPGLNDPGLSASSSYGGPSNDPIAPPAPPPSPLPSPAPPNQNYNAGYQSPSFAQQAQSAAPPTSYDVPIIPSNSNPFQEIPNAAPAQDSYGIPQSSPIGTSYDGSAVQNPTFQSFFNDQSQQFDFTSSYTAPQQNPLSQNYQQPQSAPASFNYQAPSFQNSAPTQTYQASNPLQSSPPSQAYQSSSSFQSSPISNTYQSSNTFQNSPAQNYQAPASPPIQSYQQPPASPPLGNTYYQSQQSSPTFSYQSPPSQGPPTFDQNFYQPPQQSPPSSNYQSPPQQNNPAPPQAPPSSYQNYYQPPQQSPPSSNYQNPQPQSDPAPAPAPPPPPPPSPPAPPAPPSPPATTPSPPAPPPPTSILTTSRPTYEKDCNTPSNDYSAPIPMDVISAPRADYDAPQASPPTSGYGLPQAPPLQAPPQPSYQTVQVQSAAPVQQSPATHLIISTQQFAQAQPQLVQQAPTSGYGAPAANPPVLANPTVPSQSEVHVHINQVANDEVFDDFVEVPPPTYGGYGRHNNNQRAPRGPRGPRGRRKRLFSPRGRRLRNPNIRESLRLKCFLFCGFAQDEFGNKRKR